MSVSKIKNYDAFISHSSADKAMADAACSVLERNKIRCWIAPRDVSPGREWGDEIIKGIDGSKVLLVIFSSQANESPQVRREVERAIGKGLPVLPFRIEDVVPAGAMEFALSNTHWLDGFTPPVANHLEHLARSIQSLIDQPVSVDQRPIVSKGTSTQNVPVPLAIAAANEIERPNETSVLSPNAKSYRANWKWTIGVPSALGALGLAIFLTFGQSKPPMDKGKTEAVRIGKNDVKVEALTPTPDNPPKAVTSVPVPATAAATRKGEFVPLFNGKDTTGWEPLGSEKAIWKVVNKTLIGTLPDGVAGMSFLKTTRSDYKNYHLRLTTQKSEGYETRIHLFTLPNAVNEGAARYRISLGSPQNETGQEIGRLTILKGPPIEMMKRRPKIEGKKWFDVDIISDGDHITVDVDGIRVTDYVDKDKPLRRGTDIRIVLASSLARFQKIEIKELP